MIYNPQTILLDEVEQNQRKAQEQFTIEQDDHNESLLETAFLDFDKSDEWFRNMSQGFQEVGYDADSAKRRAQLDSFMYLQTRKAGIEAKPQDFKLYQDQYAKQYFNGVGVGDDNAFHAEVTKTYTKRKDGRDMLEGLEKEAMRKSITKGGLTEYGGSFKDWKAANATRPGYDPKKEALYLDAWQRSERNIDEMTEPFRAELNAVWENFLNGKEFENAPRIEEENIPAFLAALKLRAETLPDDQQPAFWQNLSKQTKRDATGLVVNNKNFAQLAAVSVPIGGGVGGEAAGISSLLSDFTDDGSLNRSDFLSQNADKARQDQAAARQQIKAQQDFEADIRRIQQGSYDPVKQVFGEDRKWMSAIERGAYSAPGALATTATAMLPIVGLPMTYAHMQQSAYHDLRWKMLDNGADRDTAAAQAEGLSHVVAVPQVILE